MLNYSDIYITFSPDIMAIEFIYVKFVYYKY